MAAPAEAGPALASLLRHRAPVQRAVGRASGVLAAATLGLAAAYTATDGPLVLALAAAGLAVLIAVRGPQVLSPDAVRWAIVAGVVARLVVAFVAQTRPESDFLVFWDEAGSLSAPDGPGLATVLQATKAPAVVLFYGIARWLVGDGLWFPYLANAVLGGVQVLLVARIARRLTGNPAVPTAAAWVVALLPSLVLHSAVVSSEVLFTTAVLAAADVL
ncbi:hypothetical protein B7486_56000, partial [cyanobacterium TDX16]